MLESMAGLATGVRDALTLYTHPLSGAYYFVPSTREPEESRPARGVTPPRNGGPVCAILAGISRPDKGALTVTSAFPSPYCDRDPARLRGLGGDVPLLRALRRGAARDGREPLLVLELDALPGADAGVRRDLHRLARTRRSAPGRTASSRCRPRWASTTACVNGYIYISGNPVTDPAKIAERAEFFQKRAGYYFENWDELYGKWRAKMEALIAELDELRVPDLPEYEPDEVAFGDDRNTAFYEVLDAYSRALRLGDLMWQHHFEFLLLGYGTYATFAEFCKAQLPDIPDQHIAQMVAGIDVLLFRPDAELRRLARLALETGVDAAFVEGRTPAEIEAELAQSDAGRAWLAELEAVEGSVVQHGDRRRPLPLLPQLARRPEHPVRVDLSATRAR